MGYRPLFAMPLMAAMLLMYSGISAEEPKSVSILVDGDSQFDVLYSRAVSNATGVAIAGLIGAGVQAAIEDGKDKELRAELEPRVHAEHWQDHFLDVLNERLQSRNISAHWADNRNDIQADMVLQLDTDRHGFRVVDSNTMLMAAFVEFEYRVYPADLSRRDMPDFQQAYVTYKVQRPKEELLEDDVVLNQDLNEALSKAARRMANKIIYWKP